MKKKTGLRFIALGLVAGILLGWTLLNGLNVVENLAVKSTSQSIDSLLFPDKGSPARSFQLKDINGNLVSLSDYNGKVIVLNFWATWCGPCVLEMPMFDRFASEYSDQLTVLGVNMGESLDIVTKFILEKEIDYPILLDDQALVSGDYQVTGLPTTYIINPEGVIHFVHVGFMSESQFMEYLQNLGVSQ